MEFVHLQQQTYIMLQDVPYLLLQLTKAQNLKNSMPRLWREKTSEKCLGPILLVLCQDFPMQHYALAALLAQTLVDLC